jgi:hypothetical protein
VSTRIQADAAAAAAAVPAVSVNWPDNIMLPPGLVTAVQTVASAAKQPKADCADDLKFELRKLLQPMFKTAVAMHPVMECALLGDRAGFPSGKPACLQLFAGHLVDRYMA